MPDDADFSPEPIVIIGGGPAGLTAAFELSRHKLSATVLEADDQVGGISRTVNRDGWRFDIGGHRFFTKVDRVERFWHEILPDGDFLLRPRMSRIYYRGKFFDYPLRAVNALLNLGPIEAVRCLASYLMVRIRPPKDQTTFEGWVAARFGWRLYRTFFKTYTEKVWGVPADQIQADWAAQRIKNLSLSKAVINSLMPKGRKSTEVTSLIEEFQYPRLGPGMMWEACGEKVEELGSSVRLRSAVVRIDREPSGTLAVTCEDGSTHEARHVISSVAINQLVLMLNPSPPEDVVKAAHRLKHRDFLTVALVVPERFSFPDNWIYIHSQEVRVGRIQNYASWSPYMVKEGQTCLGLEYFVNESDRLWKTEDEELVALASRELEELGLATQGSVQEGFVVRMPRAYPVYDGEYAGAVETIREYLEAEWPELHPVGRNGMHRYNNQDHSMLTAMLTVDNIARGDANDIWDVNVEDEYHEEGSRTGAPSGTGRSAPEFGTVG